MSRISVKLGQCQSSISIGKSWVIWSTVIVKNPGPEGFDKKTFKIWTQCSSAVDALGLEPTHNGSTIES